MSWLAKNVSTLASKVAAEASGDNQQASNETLQQLMQELKDTREELFERHQEWELARQNYEARLSSLTEGNATAQRVEHLEQKLSRAADLLRSLNNEKESLKAMIETLKEEKSQAEVAAQEAAVTAEQAKAALNEKTAEVTAHEDVTNNGPPNASTNDSAAVAAVAATAEKIKNLEDELREKDEQNFKSSQALKDQISELIELNKDLKEQLAHQQAGSDKQIDIAIQLQMTKDELEQAKVEIARLRENNNKLVSQSDTTQESQQSQISSTALTEELMIARSTITKLEARLDKGSEQLTELTSLKTSQKDLQNALSKTQSELVKTQTKYAEVQSRLSASKEVNVALEKREAFMTDSIAQLDTQLNALKLAEEANKKELADQFMKEKLALVSSHDQLKQELEELKKKYNQERKATESSIKGVEDIKLKEQYENEKRELLVNQDAIKEELETLKTKLQEVDAAAEASLKEREKIIQELQQSISINEQQLNALKEDLQKTVNERNHFQSQHRALLDRVSNMKSTLGTKLQADMENINTLRQQIEQLTAQNNSYIQTIKQLEEELMASHEHYEKTSRELEHLRRHMVDIKEDAFAEVVEKENLIQELQSRLQREEREREDWETMASEQRASKDQAIMAMRAMERERDAARTESEAIRQELDRQLRSIDNLQMAMEELQASKESEIQFALERLQVQLNSSNRTLDEYKGRAQAAEEQLQHMSLDVERVRQLEREVKEKNLTIGKLRHDAVIQQEHLTEAMRRLREESNQNTVDIPLISNLFISFLNIPRGDQKRFEILQLISGVLKFTDEQREQAGLIRKAGSSLGAMTPTTSGSRSPSMEQMRQHQEPKESFFDMWASFLIRESNSNAASNNSSGANANARSP